MIDIAKYLFEIGELKRVSRAGWWLAGIKTPETVAEHSFRTAIIGYILASMEGADAYKCMLMCLFHDVNETRLNDMHKVVKKYIDSFDAEKHVNRDQISKLPNNLSNEIGTLLVEFEEKQTKESIIAHDADLLECLIQAREYQSNGYKVLDWINSTRAGLKTSTAQELAKECLTIEPTEWWNGLKAQPDDSSG